MDATVATSPPPRFHENSPSILLARGLSVSENVPLAQSPQSTSSPSTSISDKSEVTQSVQSPKRSPAKHNKSRVVQTYIAYNKDHQKERKLNTKTDQQPPKDGTEQNQPPQKGPHPLMMIQDDIDPKRRVLVSGFPPYTQPQDLIRVLSPFGACTIDKCRNRLAVVTFGSEECAKSAMKASEDICVYGDFIEIKPFTNPRHVEDMFKAYKKVIATQKGQDIIPPDQIDLSGDFYQQVANIQKAIKLTEEQLQAINKLYADLEMVLQQEWPGCVAVPFGSIPVGLGIKSSDADCFVRLAEEQRARGGGAGFVARARRVLQRYPLVFTHLVAIPRANTPILKFRHAPSGFHCDVNAKTPLGAQNSMLMKALLEADERLPPLALLVKYWARVHRLSGTGRLTNYALLTMLVFYLQRVRLAPPVALLQRERHLLVDHWDAGFAAPPRPAPLCALPLPDLLAGFFGFYAEFDFERLVVCPLTGEPVPKALFATPHLLPAAFERYASNVRECRAGPLRHDTPLCVQDPFEQSHNVASAVSPRLAAELRALLLHARDALARGGGGGGGGLRGALQAPPPPPPRARAPPSTKLVLLPRLRADLPQPHWRHLLRRIVVDVIFGAMLDLRLERRPAPDPAKRHTERELYSGTSTKAVWRRRKNFSVNCAESGAALVRRQRAATERLAAAGPDVRLRFDLELGFRDEPRNFYVFARMVDGDFATFAAFVAFIHTAMFDWFRILLRPYVTPLAPRATSEAGPADGVEPAEGIGPAEGARPAERARPKRGTSAPTRGAGDTDIDRVCRDVAEVKLADVEEDLMIAC